jgi:2-amino-4-hydroxy-6-hydroxymethyldihydropteridine diphosphokinase
MQTATIWIAIGANVEGAWGKPRDTFDRALRELRAIGLHEFARSGLFLTRPVGQVRQPDFLNAVFGIGASLPPASLLRLLKTLEKRAGRRANGKWGPRPLDLDILDFGGRIVGQPAGLRRRGELVLPHPELTYRGFVLVPLAEVAPGWCHPRIGVRAETLLKSRPRLARGVRRIGDWTGP